jgi:hypothetical protein
MTAKEKEPVAYFAEVRGFDERSVVAAVSHGAARYIVLLCVQDAGYQCTFRDVRIKRAHNYDILAPCLAKRGVCLSISQADLLCDVEMSARAA